MTDTCPHCGATRSMPDAMATHLKFCPRKPALEPDSAPGPRFFDEDGRLDIQGRHPKASPKKEVGPKRPRWRVIACGCGQRRSIRLDGTGEEIRPSRLHGDALRRHRHRWRTVLTRPDHDHDAERPTEARAHADAGGSARDDRLSSVGEDSDGSRTA